jgi:cytochrome c553
LAAIVAACVFLHPGPSPIARGDVLSWVYPTVGYQTPELETPAGVSHVPGSVRSYTKAELDNNLTPPDWFPEEHPAEPDVVAHSHDGGATPCAECHMMNGEGFLAVPDLAGLPAAYIVEQLKAFRTGERRSWQRDRPDTARMISAARKLSDTEIEETAAYFRASSAVSGYA